MSIRLMTMVWDSEAYAGGTLLVLLGLADFASDDGSRIFPHVETLAKKARLSIRATQNALETLKRDLVLISVANAKGGRGKSVEYQIDVKRVQNMRPDEKGAVDDKKGCNPQQERVQPETERVQFATAHIDNHQEPSREPSREPPAASPPPASSKPGLFDIDDDPPQIEPGSPLDQAYEVYAAAATGAGWAQIQKRTGARDASLRKRLKDIGGVPGWKLALERAAASDFLCGRAPPREGQQPFFADLDFLIRESSFVKLMEGKYDNRAANAVGQKTGRQPANQSFAAAVARTVDERSGRDSFFDSGGPEVINPSRPRDPQRTEREDDHMGPAADAA